MKVPQLLLSNNASALMHMLVAPVLILPFNDIQVMFLDPFVSPVYLPFLVFPPFNLGTWSCILGRCRLRLLIYQLKATIAPFILQQEVYLHGYRFFR